MAGYDDFFATPPSRLDRPARTPPPWEAAPPWPSQPATAATTTAAASPPASTVLPDPSAVDLWADDAPSVAPAASRMAPPVVAAAVTSSRVAPPVVVAPRPQVAAPIVARQVPHQAAPPTPVHEARTATTAPRPDTMTPAVSAPPRATPRPPATAGWPPPRPDTAASRQVAAAAPSTTAAWTPPPPTGGWTPALPDPQPPTRTGPPGSSAAGIAALSLGGIATGARTLLRHVPRGLMLRGIAFAVVAIGALVTTWLNAAERDDTGAVVEAGEVAASDLAVGDCFDDPGGDEFATVRAVPCAEPHDYEVFHVLDLPGEQYPPYEQVYVLAQQHCMPAFDAYVGTPWIESAYDFMPLWPTAPAWEDGDRAAVCALYDMEGASTVGSAAGTAR